MPEHVTDRPPILTPAEVSSRMLVLAELQAALAASGVRCVLCGIHRLVLRWQAPLGLSGPADPEMRVFDSAGTVVVTTDGTAYRLVGGGQWPAGNPGAAAAALLAWLRLRESEGACV